MPKGPRRPPPGWPAKLFLLVPLLFPIPSPAVQPGERILLVPFEDHSDFRGTWDLRQEIPQLLSELLRQGRAFEILPFDSLGALPAGGGESDTSRRDRELRAGRDAGADLVLAGDIRRFAIKRFNVGSPLVGGFTSYGVVVEVEARLTRVLTGRRDGDEIRGRAEVTDQDLGLTLLGKPTQTEAALARLNEVPFGAQEFRDTIVGAATLDALGKIAGELSARASISAVPEGKVLSLEGDGGFASLGLADRLEAGYRLAVHSRRDTQRVGTVQIVEVLAAHLSRFRVLEGEQSMGEGDLLRTPLEATLGGDR